MSRLRTTAAPPPASLGAILDLRVIPSLVRSGNTTKVNGSATDEVVNFTAPANDNPLE